MRKSDKLKNFKKANLLAENRYLESKGLVKDTIRNSNIGLDESNYTPHNEYKKYEKIMYIGEPRTFSNGKTVKYGDIGEYIGTEGGEECWVAFPTATGFATVFRNIKKVDEQQFESYELDEVNDFDDYEQDYNEYEKIHYISPERKSEIENLSNKYELSAVKFEKGVGGYDSVKYFNLEFRKTLSREFGETDKHKYFWVNIIKDNVKISGKENLQSMIPDETKRHQFMMDVKNLVNSILEDELA